MHKMTLFEFTLDTILERVAAEQPKRYKAAVAIVQHKNKWLLGMSTAKDDRLGKWCFPGGGIKNGESPTKAAVRECFEETGIRCNAVGEAFTFGNKKDVAFVHCRITRSNQKFLQNEEFSGLGLFTRQQMRSLRLYHNVLKLIDKIA